MEEFEKGVDSLNLGLNTWVSIMMFEAVKHVVFSMLNFGFHPIRSSGTLIFGVSSYDVGWTGK